MEIIRIDNNKIYYYDDNGFIDVCLYDDHDIRYFRDAWGVIRFPVISGYGEIQLI